ncbi:MAG: succinylglutamate desuccinylase/aspartoacylase family protein [Legionella sp.]|nr:succinylglutamate desuccinylase/aspartoacylase family protein [Legionella sp.]
MKNTTLQICDVNIQAGETANLALPLPDYNSCTSFYMPIKVIHGKEPGPCVLVFSGLDGNEFNGIEIINQLLKLDALNQLCGTLIAVPIMNVLGLISKDNTPFDRKLEYCFPGDETGSYWQRVAHVFTQQIFNKATHCIELKTGALYDDILPQVHCSLDDADTKKLAKAFLAPVINHIAPKKNSLSGVASDLNIPFLIYKAGEAMRFEESSIKIGVQGIQNVLENLSMLPASSFQDGFKPVFSLEQDWLRAHCSGILKIEVALGQYVKKNQILGNIIDPFSADTVEPVHSTQDGILIGVNRNPLVFEGQNIVQLSSFIDNNRAELTLEQWSKQHIE